MMKENLECLVTTTYNNHPELAIKGHNAANYLGMPFAERRNQSLDELKAAYGVNNILLAAKDGWKLHTSGGEFYFHLNMAHLRIKNIKGGQSDHMVDAMQLTEGMSVLDCTLGLASDAIIASYVTGAAGKVTGLEASPLIALVVGDGLQEFSADDKQIDDALRRIKVVQSNYQQFLLKQADKSWDIVYFDPMFRHPLKDSIALNPLRFLADYAAVSSEILQEAMRVARRRVVFKENSRSNEFVRLGFTKICGGKYSSVHYGVKEIDE